MPIDRIIARQAEAIERDPLVVALRADIARLERELAIERGRTTGKRAAAAHRARMAAKNEQIMRELGR